MSDAMFILIGVLGLLIFVALFANEIRHDLQEQHLRVVRHHRRKHPHLPSE